MAKFLLVFFAQYPMQYPLSLAVIALVWAGVVCLCLFKDRRQLPAIFSRIQTTPELLAFREQYSNLQCAIQSPGMLASTLYSKGIIDSYVRDKAQLATIIADRNQHLLNAVEQTIQVDPRVFHQFLDALDEPATEFLYSCLQKSYVRRYSGNTANGSQSQHRPLVESEGTQTDLVQHLPQNILISVNLTHCETVKAVDKENYLSNPNMRLEPEEQFILVVSILDADSRTPIHCVVALQDDQSAPVIGQMVCFLSISVQAVGRNKQLASKRAPSNSRSKVYHLQRRNTYTPDGKATFQICFFQANTHFSITFDVHHIIDYDGLECIGYTVESYTGSVSTEDILGRNPFKTPSLLKYEGPLATKKFQKLMSTLMWLYYDGKLVDFSRIVSRVTSDRRISLDIKFYLLMFQTTATPDDEQVHTQLEALFVKSQSLEITNGFLLQTLAWLCFTIINEAQKQSEKAIECCEHARAMCFEVAPSYLTSTVLFYYARILVIIHQDKMTSSMKKRIMILLDRSIADAYYGVQWEKILIYTIHVYKAMFCLTGTMSILNNLASSYTPTENEISLAEKHLKAAALETVAETNWLSVLYLITLSDLYWWKNELEASIEYAEKAKETSARTGLYYHDLFISQVEARLKARLPQPEHDIIDQILEEYGSPNHAY